MLTFKVTIAAPATAYKTISVEAATEDEAIEKAEEQGHRHGWLPWALSDRPSPGSPITVTEVIEDTE